jgi:hypothetical protein
MGAMTVKIPEPGIFDYFLKALGKKRGIRINGPMNGASMPYSYSTAIRESFWIALFRPKTEELPDGMADIFALRSKDGK